DMGEKTGQLTVGIDKQIFPYISSCNISCGFHGGNPFHIEKTIKAALENNIRIGAHPSYPDLEGFGRRKMKLRSSELKSIIKYQVSALKGLTESYGAKLEYVKPHGALYNEMAINKAEAINVIEAIQSIDSNLALMGLAGSHLEQIAKKTGINFIAEAFGDRQYEANGHLRSRKKEGAVIHNAKLAAEQVMNIILQQKVNSFDGSTISIKAQSICIHGDNPAVLDILKEVHKSIEKNAIQLI
ncbi:LamB/YcsF family protein, partial [Aureispira]|nr:LamB/YcsF family protein [Aureispira sp.]